MRAYSETRFRKSRLEKEKTKGFLVCVPGHAADAGEIGARPALIIVCCFHDTKARAD
jgi:hypothetical protein